MRVAYLTFGLDRNPTGIGRYALELLKAMHAHANGVEFVLLTTEREDSHGLWQQYERHALACCRLLPALMTIGNLAVSDAIRRYNLDLVHDPNGIAPFLGPAFGARRVTTIYDAFAYVHPESHNLLDNWRYQWMLPFASRRADTVITISECSRNDLATYLGLNKEYMPLVPGGIHPMFAPVPAGREREAVLTRYGVRMPYVLYLGGINARKNIARLFEAFARVRQQHPQLQLVIGGKRQWQTGQIDATYERLQLQSCVHFTGYVDDADLPALYSAAEAFVFPSLYEGFGLPPLEAMACGTPVVTSNVSSLPEVVGDAALLVDPYSVDAIAAAITRVLDDATLRAVLMRRGVEQAPRYTWEQAARKTLAVYQSVMETNQHSPGQLPIALRNE